MEDFLSNSIDIEPKRHDDESTIEPLSTFFVTLP